MVRGGKNDKMMDARPMMTAQQLIDKMDSGDMGSSKPLNYMRRASNGSQENKQAAPKNTNRKPSSALTRIVEKKLEQLGKSQMNILKQKVRVNDTVQCYKDRRLDCTPVSAIVGNFPYVRAEKFARPQSGYIERTDDIAHLTQYGNNLKVRLKNIEKQMVNTSKRLNANSSTLPAAGGKRRKTRRTSKTRRTRRNR